MSPTRTTSIGTLALAATGGALVARSLRRVPAARFAAMGGTSIAGPGAIGWITDFLNAAYFQRAPDQRSTDDLRLAFGILTTRWHRTGARRLHATDVAAFHRAFGRERFVDDATSPRGTLNREQLSEGAERLLGEGFLAAWHDPVRRAYGIAFEEVADRDAYLPELRLDAARLGALNPPRTAPHEQTWHTYPAVELGGTAAADTAVDLLARPETWPDFGAELGRFTPVRSGGLTDQTFEIEVIGEPVGPAPLLLRAYVTVTEVLTAGSALDLYLGRLNDAFARHNPLDPQPLPDDATGVAAIELTTHADHFLGRARNRLVVFTAGGRAWVRAIGNWDPLDWHLERVYTLTGRHSQHAFWGMGRPEESVLHQLAEAVARRQEVAR